MKFLSKLFLAVVFSGCIFSLPLKAMKGQNSNNEEYEEKKPISLSHLTKEKTGSAQKGPSLCRFKDFESLSVEEYVEKCYPHLSKEQRSEATRIFKTLMLEPSKPIVEDNDNDGELKKPQPESGYSFPPILDLQGPFLEFCSRQKNTRVLDIGSGSGNDTIPLLLSGRGQVVAVDIHEKQLNLLKERVGKFIKPTKLFSTYKKDFAAPKTTVHKSYKGAFQAANMNKVAHFLTGPQLTTMLGNVSEMLCEGGVLSLTVSTYLPGSKEEKWVEHQTKEGLTDPGLVYFANINNVFTAQLLGGRYFNFSLVNREECNLPGPGYKAEYLYTNKKGEEEHMLLQGRFYHTLESLRKYLDPHFEIVDDAMKNLDGEDVFLSVLAVKKSKL